MKIDLAKWNAKRLETEAEIRRIKAARSESYQPNLKPGDLGALRWLKQDATRLYAIRAHLRKHLHEPRKFDLDGQADFIGQELEKYLIQEQAAA